MTSVQHNRLVREVAQFLSIQAGDRLEALNHRLELSVTDEELTTLLGLLRKALAVRTATPGPAVQVLATFGPEDVDPETGMPLRLHPVVT